MISHVDKMADSEQACSVNFEDVLETSNYFSSLVDLIPAKFYVASELKENGFNNKKKLTKGEKKLLTKKAKLLRLDPSQHKSTEELQLEIEKKEKEMLETEVSNEKIKPINVSEAVSVPLEELREKLHAKLEQVRGKRKFTPNGDKDVVKKARVERKDKAKKKKDTQKLSTNIKRATSIEEKSVATKNSIKNDKGELVFSKFDFATSNGTMKKKSKDIKKLLQKAEKTQENIEKLEGEDSDKAKKLKDKIAWDKALKKAEGQKLKDDPKLLKKTLKRKEKMKSHSQKKWKDRTETVEKQKEERQKKRTQNLKQRREEKMKKSGGKGKKKNSKPGF